MQLSLMMWPEVETYIKSGPCVMLPAGSIEQHGPMGLIGTDSICAQAVAERAPDQVGDIFAQQLLTRLRRSTRPLLAPLRSPLI